MTLVIHEMFCLKILNVGSFLTWLTLRNLCDLGASVVR